MPGLQQPKNPLLRRARFDAGLTQQELADKVGVGRQRVVAYERDGVVPRVKTARRIADVFGVEPTDLFPLVELEVT